MKHEQSNAERMNYSINGALIMLSLWNKNPTHSKNQIVWNKDANNDSKHLFDAYYMPALVLSILYMPTHLFPQQPYVVGTVNITSFYKWGNWGKRG